MSKHVCCVSTLASIFPQEGRELRHPGFICWHNITCESQSWVSGWELVGPVPELEPAERGRERGGGGGGGRRRTWNIQTVKPPFPYRHTETFHSLLLALALSSIILFIVSEWHVLTPCFHLQKSLNNPPLKKKQKKKNWRPDSVFWYHL